LTEKTLGSVSIVDCWQCQIPERVEWICQRALWVLDRVALLAMGGKPPVFGFCDGHLVGAPR
jgi:hypothetical protein